ncbi:MAG: FHA domain-containing protein [Alphaproteobacteria bacterium]
MRRYLIGRSEHNDIVVQDASVSRQHAELEELSGGRFALRDLGSTYGMALWRDGKWIEVLEVELVVDSRVRLGGFETSPRDLLALARGDGQPVGAASPAPQPKHPRAPTHDSRLPASEPDEHKGKSRALVWSVAGALAVLLAGLAGAGYFYGPALWNKFMTPTFGDRVQAYCDRRQVSRPRCACQIKLLQASLTERERQIYLDSLETGRGALAALSDAERTAFGRKTTDASQEAARICPK